jgi:hypothetical protein
MTDFGHIGESDEGNTGNRLGSHEPLSLNTDIALSDYHLFGSVKVHIGGQISD